MSSTPNGDPGPLPIFSGFVYFRQITPPVVVPADPATARDIDVWGEEVRNYSSTYIGSSNVFLDGDCRLKECNLGNMLADAYVNHGTKPLVDGARLNDVTIAIFNSGSIRSPMPVGKFL